MAYVKKINGVDFSPTKICQIALRNLMYQMFEDRDDINYYSIMSYYGVDLDDNQEFPISLTDSEGNTKDISAQDLESLIVCNLASVCCDYTKSIKGTEGSMILINNVEISDLDNLSVETRRIFDILEEKT